MGINSEIIHGHDLLAVERFKDATRHMIILKQDHHKTATQER